MTIFFFRTYRLLAPIYFVLLTICAIIEYATRVCRKELCSFERYEADLVCQAGGHWTFPLVGGRQLSGVVSF